MRRLLAIALPAVLLLAGPGTAGAKGILGAKVCGADGCQTVGQADRPALGGGSHADPPATREPFVRLDVSVGVAGHAEQIRLLFLPRSGIVLAADGSTWLHAIRLRELRAIARRVTPFPGAALPDSVAPAPRQPVAPPSHAQRSSELAAWWLTAPAGVIALAGAAAVALGRRRERRRRGDSPARAAGATG